jgi:hypothetical protein
VNDPQWEIEEVDEDIERMGSVMDHIEGYPKIYNYSLNMNGTRPKKIRRKITNQTTEEIPRA